jgi:predicted alpha/beta hydrolase family esterase
MKKQVIIIHGGGTFATYEAYISFLEKIPLDIDRLKPRNDWKATVQNDLGDVYEVLQPAMPNKANAQYPEWKLWFEKVLAITDKEIILVGHSLGALFLAKYLSENITEKNIVSLHLVSGPFNSEGLEDEELGTFSLPGEFPRSLNQINKIFIYHSTDDKVVPVSHANKYNQMLPDSKLMIFETRGHIKMLNFPELVENIISNSK